MQRNAWKRLLEQVRPKTLEEFWSAAAFLIAVFRLLLVRGIWPGALILFLFPPFLAIIFRYSHRKSTRIMATLFLTLIDFGVAIGPLPWLFPGLPPLDARLSQADNRALAWYVLVYLLYAFVILPPFVFGRGVLDRRRGAAQFSAFTNVLGLIAWALVGPLMCWFCATRFGLWPPMRW